MTPVMARTPGKGPKYCWAIDTDKEMVAKQLPPTAPAGEYWQDKFDYSVMVRGFPTACRPELCPGIEVPPEILFDFVQMPNLEIDDGRILLHGSGKVLKLIKRTKEVVVWQSLDSSHEACSCRSYTFVDDGISSSLTLIELWNYRHVLGGCGCTKISSGNCESFAQPYSREVSPIASVDTLAVSPLCNQSSRGELLGSSLVTDSPSTSLDSDMLSIPESSGDLHGKTPDADDAVSPILNTVARRLLSEYRVRMPETRLSEVVAGSRPMGQGSSNENNVNIQAPSNSFHGPEVPTWIAAKFSRKRSGADENNDGSDENPTPSNPKRPRGNSSDRYPKLLACPFWKMDSRKHRGCFRMKLDKVSRVKQHLTRNHTPTFYCERCLVIFPCEESHEKHVGGYEPEQCRRGSVAQLDGISHRQHRELSKKSKPNLAKSEQWFAIWDIVFPHHPRPSSAYVDPGLSEDLCQFREYAQSRGSTMLVDELHANGFVSVAQEETGLHLQRVIANGINMMVEEWLSNRTLPSHSTAFSGSSSSGRQRNHATFPTTQNGTPMSSFADSGVGTGSQVTSSRSQLGPSSEEVENEFQPEVDPAGYEGGSISHSQDVDQSSTQDFDDNSFAQMIHKMRDPVIDDLLSDRPFEFDWEQL